MKIELHLQSFKNDTLTIKYVKDLSEVPAFNSIFTDSSGTQYKIMNMVQATNYVGVVIGLVDESIKINFPDFPF